jgi:hypothetical protein
MKGYPLNPALRAAILDQLPLDLPAGNKAEKPRSVILNTRGVPMQLVASQADADKASASLAASISEACFETCLPPPGDTGEESISAQEEMRMACAWLMSLGDEDAIAALSVLRSMREGWTP